MLIYPPGMIMNWVQTYAFLSNIIKSGNRFVASPNRKQTNIVLCTMNSQRQDSWTSINSLRPSEAYMRHDHRVALVVHRAQKSVPDSAGEWPTFLPPPLESCSGTANADGPKLFFKFCSVEMLSVQFASKPPRETLTSCENQRIKAFGLLTWEFAFPIKIYKDIQRTPLFHDLTLNNG